MGSSIFVASATSNFAPQTSLRPSIMPTGTVKKWMDEKGFGFISPDDGGEDAFCHRSCLEGTDALSEGDVVEYEVEYDDRKGKYKCSYCTLKSGGGGGGGGGGGYGGGGGKGKGKGKRYDPY